MNRRDQAAFTLVEVLVAVTILATCLTAAFTIVRTAAAGTDHLYDVTLATWIARDEALRLRLEDVAPPDAVGTSTVRQLGRSYEVVVSFTEDAVPARDGDGEYAIAVRSVDEPAAGVLVNVTARPDPVP